MGKIYLEKILNNSYHLNRKRNYFIVLNLIRNFSPITKSEIAKRTGLTHPTVSSIIEELREKGLVKIGGKKNSSGGRKPRFIEFCNNSGFILGIEMGLGFYGILADLKGNIISRKSIQLPQTIFDIARIENFIKKLIKNYCSLEKIIGIGIGIACLVTNEGEYVIRTTKEKIPIKKTLEEKFGVPILVENDADMGMIAEHQIGVAKEVKNAIYILKRREGIGLGILVEGKILKGANGFAGENFEVIPQRAITDLDKGKLSTLLVKSIIRLIGLFDPEMIILGGELSELENNFVKTLKEKIIKYDDINREIKIELAKLGRESVVIGAVNSVLQKLFTFNLY